METLPNDTNLNSYLYAAVKNSCLNYYKHLKVEDSNKSKLTKALIYMGTSEYEDDSELFHKIQECLQRLPEQQRNVLELKIFQKMSYHEIAERLNVSEATVHTHVKRAYKFLRESLPFSYIMLMIAKNLL